MIWIFVGLKIFDFFGGLKNFPFNFCRIEKFLIPCVSSNRYMIPSFNFQIILFFSIVLILSKLILQHLDELRITIPPIQVDLLKFLYYQFSLEVYILVVLLQIDYWWSPNASSPIWKERWFILILHIMQILYDFNNTLLYHIVLHVLWIAVEVVWSHDTIG